MKDLYKSGFHRRIKEARLRTGFSQGEVSRETGINRTKISKYETGDLEPTIEILGTLTEFYGTSADWLLGIGTQPENRPNYDRVQPRRSKVYAEVVNTMSVH